MDTKHLAKLGWLLALSPLWLPIVAVCLIVIAAVVIVNPVIGIVLAFLVAMGIIGKIEARRQPPR